MRLLDLFCGAGGAAMGYHRAGFEVVGVDIAPQYHYPFEYRQTDALEILDWMIPGNGVGPYSLGSFDAIHASPPCQAYAASTAWRGRRENHPRLIGRTRDLLEATGLPFVIENVPDARRELRNPLLLCGSQFGLPFRRHRFFETNWPMPILVYPCRHLQTDLAFEHKDERAYTDAIGCHWMTNVEGREAIPPIYTDYIGRALAKYLATVTV